MSKLYLVPTPIGNLEDITLRAIRILKEVDAILAEDTRTSGNLLRHLEISKPMMPFHIRNEHQVVERIADRIEAGETLALVTDAGTPAISDPGFLLVRECVKRNIEVECLPGPTAFVPATILYESPFRLLKTLQQLAEVCGPERKACVSRELTKIHEENARGTLAELIEHFSKKEIKGEIVIVLEGASAYAPDDDSEE